MMKKQEYQLISMISERGRTKDKSYLHIHIRPGTSHLVFSTAAMEELKLKVDDYVIFGKSTIDNSLIVSIISDIDKLPDNQREEVIVHGIKLVRTSGKIVRGYSKRLSIFDEGRYHILSKIDVPEYPWLTWYKLLHFKSNDNEIQ